MIKKKRFTYALIAGMLAGMLTACGGEYTGISEENAVSGSAVSGAAVEEMDTEVKRYEYPVYYTDTNWYYDLSEEGIISQRLDGTHKKVVKIKDFDELLTVADGYLYYMTWSIDKEGVSSSYIYRMPLKKDESGFDKVIMEERELLVEEVDEEGIAILDVYVSPSCIFYTTDSDEFVRFDLQTRKKKIVDAPVMELHRYWGVLFESGDQIYMEIEEQGLFVWENEMEKWFRLTEHNIYDDISARTGGACFYCCKAWEDERNAVEGIRRIDLQRGTEEVFVTEEQLRQAAKEAEGLHSEEELDFCAVTALFYEDERLYVQAQMNWIEEDEYHVGCVVFSQGQGETSLRYEKGLTECMREHGVLRRGKLQRDNYSELSAVVENPKEKIINERTVLHDACCFMIVHGKAFMYGAGSDEIEKQKIGCYELSTGEYRQLTKRDFEFYLPAIYGDSVYENIYMYYEEDAYDPFDDSLQYNMIWFEDEGEKELPFISFIENEGGKEK